ncbi:hypothetical protein [Geminocystis sp. GBBB08]|uniref:hypothetical protein n=1 Tax=Geminocystis sp. GBBB08 TaxID=2604140 RepID=UPI0027E2897B|nr:hypothetical protein [Geminocystis sp. GBBB08]MBL1209291.1 hypothetical protein [Geminocystis sp. GBBB08]
MIYNYYEKKESLSLKLTKLNLALLKLSSETGISIIDVDQILAESGANQYLVKILEYTPQGYQLIAIEFVRVLEDVGFFEHRPLLVQMGNREK